MRNGTPIIIIALIAASAAVAQMSLSPMQVDATGALVVPNKSAWQDVNGVAARDRANTFTAANTFLLLPTVPVLPGRVIVGNATSNGAAVAVSGDVTMNSTGLVQCVGISTNLVVLSVDGNTNTLTFTRGLLTTIVIVEP